MLTNTRQTIIKQFVAVLTCTYIRADRIGAEVGTETDTSAAFVYI